MDIARRIKKRRRELGLSAEQIASELNVSKTTIYRYESKEIEKFPVTIVEPLAKALKTTPSFLMGWTDDPKEDVKDSSGNSICPIIKQCINDMVLLTSDGRNIVLQKAEEIRQVSVYQADNPDDDVTGIYQYTLEVSGTAAAGAGVWNTEYSEHYRVVMSRELPEYDFSVDVKGVSMEPTLFDGDILFCRKNFDYKDHEIYVLNIDGATVVKRTMKKQDKLILVSDNTNFPDREISGFELEQTRIEGVVVAWETPVK